MPARNHSHQQQLELFGAPAMEATSAGDIRRKARGDNTEGAPDVLPVTAHQSDAAAEAGAAPHDPAPRETGTPVPWLLDEHDRRPVQPARVLAEHRIAAARLPIDLRLGTSSWTFPGWQGIVFAGRHSAEALARDGLWAYARHPLLRTVGVDRTYYAPVTADVLRAYAEQVPQDFRFLVKMWEGVLSPADGRSGAARPEFLDAQVAVDRCVRPFVDGLGEKGGVLLMQFPPLPLRTLGGVRSAIALMDRFFSALPTYLPMAVEVRNREFFCDEWFEVLAARNVVHCVNSHPSVPRVGQQSQWLRRFPQSRLVVRWMLAHGRTYSEAKDEFSPFHQLVAPDDVTREELVELLLSQAPAKDMLVVINNKAEGSSPLSSFGLAQTLARRLARPVAGTRDQ
jgi:uncharacterized protein YecE (DUF72 family)